VSGCARSSLQVSAQKWRSRAAETCLQLLAEKRVVREPSAEKAFKRLAVARQVL
jgi:hypothetical protein